jgi:hypothetical protein
MKGKKIWMAALAILLCISLRALQIQGDQWNKKTILTVKETIQIPGATLTPGRYVFRLHDSSSNRHIVQVFNEQENHVLTTIVAIPNYRLKPTGDSEFGFWEMPQGSPPALRSWFYPGDNFGQEFAYPKSEATQLAAVTHQNVPSLSDEEQATFNQEAKSTPAAELRPEQPRSEASSEPRPVEPSTTAQVTPREYPKAPSTVSSADQTRTPTPVHTAVPAKLPGTASSLPLIGLLGCGSLVVGSVFRRLRSSR